MCFLAHSGHILGLGVTVTLPSNDSQLSCQICGISCSKQGGVGPAGPTLSTQSQGCILSSRSGLPSQNWLEMQAAGFRKTSTLTLTKC